MSQKEIRSILTEVGEDALIAALCTGAGITAGAAEFFYRYAMAPRKHNPAKDLDPDEPSTRGRFWMHASPARRDVVIRSEDGLQLHGNFIPAEHPSDVYVICVHGYGDSAGSMGIYARHYHDAFGMNVLLPDLRGHGLSDGTYVGYGVDDSRDILCWIDWVLERDRDARIILHGHSMGAATVLMTTGEVLPSQVVAAVSDSSYTSAMDQLSGVYKKTGMPIPASVLMPMVRGIALLHTHYDIARAVPAQAVTRSKTPTLFIHGEKDRSVAPEMMPVLYARERAPKACFWGPQSGHVRTVRDEPELYWKKVGEFLEQICPGILDGADTQAAE